MFNTYVKLDKDVIQHIEKTTQEIILSYLEAISQKRKLNGLKTYFLLCPYCKNSLIVFVNGLPKFCTKCGETNPFQKLENSINKASILYRLVHESDEQVTRVLLEQCMVILATCIEVFLRDIYSTTLNLRYIKRGQSIIERFYNEVKNDFINTGKIRKRFKEMGVDIKNTFGKEVVKDINLLLLKRNVIVHNNGIIDKAFLSSSGLNVNIGSKIEISKDEIENCISLVNDLSNGLEEFYKSEFFHAIYEELVNYFNDINSQEG
ncbi:hypothetical protein [Priestia aryabhattai]|uniref:hypothetical protein n=1 Tax=Priestia aryabhattai TaxID=412384 RepID=UPI001C8EDA99|nr:hypothetical protein [Priestia aryabhattai]MBX9997730.1 hypothetical protein [Priestia aryabhattai]